MSELRDGAGAAPMLRSHLTNDAHFTVPAEWEDRSITMFTAPPVAGDGGGASEGTPGFSVTLHRDALRPGEDLAAYVARQMAQLEGVITDLDILRQGARVVGGVPGWEVEFRWVGPQGRLRQHQVHVLRDGRVLTWTATAPAARYGDYVEAFTALLASVRFVAPAFVVAPGATPTPGAGPAQE